MVRDKLIWFKLVFFELPWPFLLEIKFLSGLNKAWRPRWHQLTLRVRALTHLERVFTLGLSIETYHKEPILLVKWLNKLFLWEHILIKSLLSLWLNFFLSKIWRLRLKVITLHPLMELDRFSQHLIFILLIKLFHHLDLVWARRKTPLVWRQEYSTVVVSLIVVFNYLYP